MNKREQSLLPLGRRRAGPQARPPANRLKPARAEPEAA